MASSQLSLALIEHWDGHVWSIVPSARPSVNDLVVATLYGVASTSATDVWAVGEYSTGAANSAFTLIEHWNGVRWSIVPDPATHGQAVLWQVSAVSSKDAWAVGGTQKEARLSA
jgi:hypothetical protein